MKPLGAVRIVNGARARVCGEQCRVELADLVHRGGVITPTYHDGDERLDLFVASRRFGFCAGCGADLRPPLPPPQRLRVFRDPRGLPIGAGPKPRPSGELPRPCRLGAIAWRPDVARCLGCDSEPADRPWHCHRRRVPEP